MLIVDVGLKVVTVLRFFRLVDVTVCTVDVVNVDYSVKPQFLLFLILIVGIDESDDLFFASRAGYSGKSIGVSVSLINVLTDIRFLDDLLELFRYLPVFLDHLIIEDA